MALDPRAPVLVGVGQLNNRIDDGAEPLEPIDLVAEALRVAEADSGAARVLAGADSVRIVNILSWRYTDPGALVAERLGASPGETVHTTGGGNTPQMLVNQTALDIQAGRADLVLLGGAEAWRSRMAARKAGRKPNWTLLDDSLQPTRTLGRELNMNHQSELARGIVLPVQMYPLIDTAIRAARGWTLDEHRDQLGRLWSRFSEVAAANPHAWIQEPMRSEAIREPSSDNRMVGFPYTKLMNSNNHVEQGAALVLCSVERAEALGISADRWVFPLAGTDAQDQELVTHRQDLHRSPAIRLSGEALFEMTGTGPDDLAHVDLYSCFPSAVQVAADELGLRLDRDLTVTGGMSFAGGPWNDYVTHSIATMASKLREDPAAVGLCTANGGFLAKHSLGLYSATPQEAASAMPRHKPRSTPYLPVKPPASTRERSSWRPTPSCTIVRASPRTPWPPYSLPTVAGDGAPAPTPTYSRPP